jgi:TonB family protein
MNWLNRLVVAAGFAGCLSLGAFAGDIKVIANPNIKPDSISADELRRVFLEETISLADGTHVEPVLRKSGPIHEAFLREYLGKTNDDLQTYYRSLVFAGRASMPKELGSDADVVVYVTKTRGAIGYVSAEADTGSVKVLEVIRGEIGNSRALIKKIEPQYPETLKRLGIGGTVRLQVTISPKGSVEGVEILGGNPILAEAAIAAVRQWVYAPAHSTTTLEVTIPFIAQ